MNMPREGRVRVELRVVGGVRATVRARVQGIFRSIGRRIAAANLQ